MEDAVILPFVRHWIIGAGGAKLIYSALICTYYPAVYSLNRPVKILDVGCGDGKLMGALVDVFNETTKGSIEIYGFEVSEHGARLDPKAFRASLVGRLKSHDSRVAWEDRVAVVSQQEPWPFRGITFDVIISSQVVEHVHDVSKFAHEHARRLAADGVGIHGYPPMRTLVEPHVRIPFGHWLSSWRFVQQYFAAYLFVTRRSSKHSKWRTSRPELNPITSDANAAHDYLRRFTAFRPRARLKEHFDQWGLRLFFPTHHAVQYGSRLLVGSAAISAPFAPSERSRGLTGFIVGLLGYEIAIVRHRD